jgi:ribosomal protein S18 acetylase RimI-like enzyme
VRDLRAIARLSVQTVRQVNARDYSQAQIRAWAPRIESRAVWRRRLLTHKTFVAEFGQELAGFAELGPAGHVDCFYTDYRYQGCGVGRALMRRLTVEARGVGSLGAEVSLTARGFFEGQGFVVVGRRQRRYRGQRFRQFLMTRRSI